MNYFRRLQTFSDAVAELTAGESTPFALHEAIEAHKAAEGVLSQRNNRAQTVLTGFCLAAELERSIVQKLMRRRFLESLKEKTQDEHEACHICGEVGEAQSKRQYAATLRKVTSTDSSRVAVVLTPCGHLFHHRCLQQWCKTAKAGQRNCPVCRGPLPPSTQWQRIKRKDDNNAHPAKGLIGGTDTLGSLTETRESVHTDNQAWQLNYIQPDMLEDIQDIKLSGEALGTKLDTIVKHVIHLTRNKEAQEGENNDDVKILIYSGWAFACDVLARALEKENIGFVSMESGWRAARSKKNETSALLANAWSSNGSGSRLSQKEMACIRFKEDPSVKVFILHAGSQAAGLVSTSSLVYIQLWATLANRAAVYRT